MTIKQKGNGNEHDKVVANIRKILCQYSIKDVAYSLLISSLWLPNIASAVKHQLLYAIFLSIDEDKFSEKDRVYKYKDFTVFLSKLYSFLPEFPWIEDYVPEPDWGNLRFHLENKDYKFFYGSEISNVYDYLILFQVLYASRDKDYKKMESRSPSQELQMCLSLQNAIISGITTQPAEADLDISPGDLETPPEDYWTQ